jgi:heme-degrading monooxygenase HmoA
MIAVIFEVIPNEGQKDEYFKIASALRPALEKIHGFISIERFQSINDPAKVLSLSFWKDEESIRQWRGVEMHRRA